MAARLLNRTLSPHAESAASPKRPSGVADAGYEALSRLSRLRDFLVTIPLTPRNRWKVPPLFFFDTRHKITCPTQQPSPYGAAAEQIAAELPLLCNSVEVRRVARTIEGLSNAAVAIAPMCAAAKSLVELLAIPDDEVILVLHPESRTGFRMAVRGVADVGQFHVLMSAAISEHRSMDFYSAQAIPDRFVQACRNAGPAIPAGIPMVMEARFQLYTSAAIRPDGTLPTEFAGSDHWLWPTSLLAAIPRIDGERVVLLGPPVYRAKWDVSSRFQGMPADLRAVESLGSFRVAERLSRLTGKPVSPIPHREQERELLKAA